MFDLVVVTVAAPEHARFWERRLGRTGAALATDFEIVVEDRPLGNGGGTLRALRLPGVAAAMASGRSVAIVHAAGAGSRLEPLTTMEGSKPAVRLPGWIDGELITLLEAVLRQAAPLAAIGKGRATVLWGDQLFAAAVPEAPSAHAALFARPLPHLDAATWQRLGLYRYGLLAVGQAGAMQLEKLTWPLFAALRPRLPATIAQSLGSFSLSAALADALCSTFSEERLDADRDWWMPLSLPLDLFVAAGGQATAHARLAPLRELAGALVGATVLPDAGWWDFGTLAAYYDSSMALLEPGPAGDALRSLLQIDPRGSSSVVAGCTARVAGRRSVVVGATEDVDLDDVLVYRDVVCSMGPQADAGR